MSETGNKTTGAGASSAPKIEIYTKPDCPYCSTAKEFLTKFGLRYEEIGIVGKPEMRTAMIARANGRTTVPQIFVRGHHVGGCDDMLALHGRGGFLPLVQGTQET